MKKKKKLEKTFEQLLYELRVKAGLSRHDLVNIINDKNIQEKTIRRWESGLDYPDINRIYTLSEIYKVPSEELLLSKQLTLEAGLEGIHYYIIKCISFLMGVSIYGAIWTFRILVGCIFVFLFLFYREMCIQMQVW